MKIIVAPGSYKGSMTARQAAEAMAQGVLRVLPDAKVLQMPMADGGSGTVEALVRATEGEIMTAEVTGPLGDRVDANWGMLGDGKTAVVEMCAASGHTLVPAERRDPMRATTYGTGELIRAALDQGAQRLIVGLGDSATVDGGAGCVEALGVKFLDAAGRPLPRGPLGLKELASLDLSGFDARISKTDMIVACDSLSPLTGAQGASRVYAPQKGATPEMVEELELILTRYARVLQERFHTDVSGMNGAGAAGGLGAGLAAFCGGKLLQGAQVVMNQIGFNLALTGAALVLTGEGRLDAQTRFGKTPCAVAERAKKMSVPVIVVAGAVGEDARVLYECGVDAMLSLVPGPVPAAEAVRQGTAFLTDASERALRCVRIGIDLGRNP